MSDSNVPPVSPNNRLFVGNLAWGTTDESLLSAFEGACPPGVVVEAKVIIDRYSGRSRGYGFVTFDTSESAAMAKDNMHNKEIDGRQVRVDLATSTQGGNSAPRR